MSAEDSNVPTTTTTETDTAEMDVVLTKVSQIPKTNPYYNMKYNNYNGEGTCNVCCLENIEYRNIRLYMDRLNIETCQMETEANFQTPSTEIHEETERLVRIFIENGEHLRRQPKFSDSENGMLNFYKFAKKDVKYNCWDYNKNSDAGLEANSDAHLLEEKYFTTFDNGKYALQKNDHNMYNEVDHRSLVLDNDAREACHINKILLEADFCTVRKYWSRRWRFWMTVLETLESLKWISNDLKEISFDSTTFGLDSEEEILELVHSGKYHRELKPLEYSRENKTTNIYTTNLGTPYDCGISQGRLYYWFLKRKEQELYAKWGKLTESQKHRLRKNERYQNCKAAIYEFNPKETEIDLRAQFPTVRPAVLREIEKVYYQNRLRSWIGILLTASKYKNLIECNEEYVKDQADIVERLPKETVFGYMPPSEYVPEKPTTTTD